MVVSWRDWSLPPVAGYTNQRVCWSATWGPGLGRPFSTEGSSAQNPLQGCSFLLSGDLRFPALLFPPPTHLSVQFKAPPGSLLFLEIASPHHPRQSFLLGQLCVPVPLLFHFYRFPPRLRSSSVLNHMTISLSWLGVDVAAIPPMLLRCWGQTGTLGAFLEKFKVSSNKGDTFNNKWEIQCFYKEILAGKRELKPHV